MSMVYFTVFMLFVNANLFASAAFTWPVYNRVGMIRAFDVEQPSRSERIINSAYL